MADSRDPRTRYFRRAFLGIHVLVTLVFAVALTTGVWRGISEIRPARTTPPGDVAACLDRLEDLRAELLERLGSFPNATSAAAEGRAFGEWSVEYRARLLSARASCKKPAGASPAQAEAIREAFGAVVRTLDLSAISATHWARHLGPSLDETRELLEAARKP